VDLVEIPSCPVCLERLDASECGILTMLCNHSYHMKCISSWNNSSCPVCRYCLSPQSFEENTKCKDCESVKSLWICLICGNIGCGRFCDFLLIFFFFFFRYEKTHAQQHFVNTSHNYALELDTQRVWDYTRDGFFFLFNLFLLIFELNIFLLKLCSSACAEFC
jgi:BRCA1-associated protein